MESNNGSSPHDETTNLRKRYLSLARCIQAAALSQRGTAIVNVSVVVDASGHPHFWTSPEVTKIEPASSEKLIQMLANRQKV